MNTKKEWILNQIRSRYERKFGTSDDVKKWIDNELEILAKKEKLSVEDFNDIDNKLSMKSRFSSRNHSFDIGADRPITSINSRRGSRTPLRPLKIESANDSSQPKNENYNSRISVGSVITDNSLMNTSPFTKKVLQKYDAFGIDTNKHNTSFQETYKGFPSLQTSQFQLRTEGDKDPASINPEKYRRPSREKVVTRDAFHQENIWKKIQEHQFQQYLKEEQQKLENTKKLKEDWRHTLQEQIKVKQNKTTDVYRKDREIENKMIVDDLARQKDMLDKDKSHKIYVRGHERKNIDYAVDRAVKFKQDVDIEKKRDAEMAAKYVEEFQKELEEKKKAELLRKREFSKWQEEMIQQKQQTLLQQREIEKKQGEKHVEHVSRLLKKEEDEVEQFYEKIRDRTRIQKDPYAIRGFDNLRRYRKIEEDKDAQGLKFLHSFDKTLEAQQKKKEDEKKILQSHLSKQVVEKYDREASGKKYLKDQSSLWKNEEEVMQNREKLEAHGERLKKLLQKQQLDEQLHEIKKSIKPYNNHEILINKQILSEMGHPIPVITRRSTDSP